MEKFFKYSLVICLLSVSSLGLTQTKRDKMEAMRIAFITSKVELSPAESEKFWPLYNEYHSKIKELRKNLKAAYQKKTEPITEADAKDLYTLELKFRQDELEVHKEYTEKIKNTIGYIKLVKLRQAEDQFRHEMIKAMDK